jgi:hypothetical protein
MILDAGGKLDRMPAYDGRGIRAAGQHPPAAAGKARPGWYRRSFPSEVQRPPVRQLTAEEGRCLVDWLGRYRRRLCARLGRLFWHMGPPDWDSVENCLHEGVFALADRICQHPEPWAPQRIADAAYKIVWSGMVLACVAMRYIASHTDGTSFGYRQPSQDGDGRDGELEAADQAEQSRPSVRGLPITDRTATLLDLLTRLDGDKFELLVRYYVDEQEICQIAEALGVPTGTVYQRLLRMGAKLRTEMAAAGREADHGR